MRRHLKYAIEHRSNFVADWVFSGEHYLNINYGIRSWLLTVDHKRIGTLYAITGFIFFLIGGFEALLIRSQLAVPDGTLIVGGTNRGWGSRGSKPFALERLRWTGKVPFEIHEMHAKKDGFELTFTHSVDPETASRPESYQLSTYTYIYQAAYGSPEVDHTTPTIDKVTVAANGNSVRLVVTGLQEGHVHELHSAGVRSKDGLPLLHKEAYYTLNYLVLD